MVEAFLRTFNISITVSYIVVAVMLLRVLLKKAPKWVNCVLWALVGVRLIIPFSIEAAWSLIPSAHTVPEYIGNSPSPSINSGIPIVNEIINPVISETFAPNFSSGVYPMEKFVTVVSIFWGAGVIAMIIYGVISYLRVKRKTAPSIEFYDNVYYCDDIDTPFILGVFRPRIYLPSGISERDMKYVIDHEKAHLKRGDHIWKPLGFLLLAIYWFNPLLWVAYLLLCRDIEKACDERVIKDMDFSDKKGYSEALIGCSVHRRVMAVCPLAFGEVSVKGRIKSVLDYKKPTLWIIIVAVVACVGVGVFFLTDPIMKVDAIPIGGSHGCLVSLPTEIIRLNTLRKAYPEYFDQDSMKGIEIYIEELPTGDYGCKLMEGTNRLKTKEELDALSAVSIDDMRLIMSTYDIPDNYFSVVHYDPSKSDTFGECFDRCDEELCEKLFRK